MDLLGGQYPADQNPDGTWNIRGLPVFGENTRRFGDKEMVVDREWLGEALALANERADAQYLAPLHSRHHPDSPHAANQCEAIGFLRPTHVGTMKHDGKEIGVLYADYLSLPEDVYARFKKRQMPYVSVEVPFGDRPEIVSAAILSDEKPFFTFPMQTIGSETPYVLASVLIDREPVLSGATTVAAFRAPKGVSFLSRFPQGGAPLTHVTQEQLDELSSGIEAKFAALTEQIAKFAAAPSPEPDAEEVETDVEDGSDDEGADGIKDGPVTAEQVNDVNFSASEITLQARLDTVETKLAKRDEKDAEAARYKAAKAELEDDGYHVSVDREKSLKRYAAQGDEALAAYVAATREGPPGPPETIDGLTRGGGRSVSDSEAIVTFASGDPDRLAFARRASEEFASLKSAGLPLRSTEEQFIASRFAQSGETQGV